MPSWASNSVALKATLSKSWSNGDANEGVNRRYRLRRPLHQRVVGQQQELSRDENDQVVEVTDEQVTFGVKDNPQRLDRSNGVLRGANGLIIAVCSPAGSGKKF